VADLTAFLARHTPLAEGVETWGGPDFPQPLRLTWYCTDEEPPLALVTSVRAIVVRGDQVLVLHEPAGKQYIIPGGRCEAGESPEETLRREVLEETGWSLGAIQPLGFIHLRNLGPKPPEHPYPYPDAFQIVRLAEADAFRPEALIYDEWVAGSAFLPVEHVRALALRAGERVLLEAALLRRGVGDRP
jgi:8-oxo-dGTP pyrophosphatase MutT (NUDIX family)